MCFSASWDWWRCWLTTQAIDIDENLATILVSPTYTPTVIVPVSGTSGVFSQTGMVLINRLFGFFQAGAVAWIDPFDPNQADYIAQLSSAISPFLNISLWHKLSDLKIVETLPDESHPIQLRLLAVYDGITSTDKTIAEKRLEQFINDLISVVGRSIDLRVALILLGDIDLRSDLQRQFWPRIRLGTTGLGGMQVETETVFQVCENLIVGLLSSDLEDLLTKKVQGNNPRVGWINLGAASIMVDITPMETYFRLQLLEKFLKPLELGSLTDQDHQKLAEQAGEFSKKYQGYMAKEASNICHDLGWDIIVPIKNNRTEEGVEFKDYSETTQVQKCYMSPGTELTKHILGEDWWSERIWIDKPVSTGMSLKTISIRIGWNLRRYGHLLTHRPSLSLDPEIITSELARNYQHLDTELTRRLEEPVNEQYGLLLEWLRLRLGYQKKLLGPPIIISEKLKSGLSTIAPSAAGLVDWLSTSPDLISPFEKKEGVTPETLGSEAYWRLAANIDTSNIQGEIRKYERYSRMILSPIGLILKLFVAWPLLYGLFALFTRWDTWQSAVISLLLVALLGLSELIYWRMIRANRLLTQVQNKIEETLAKRVLGIMVKSLADYRRIVITRLIPIHQSFSNLTKLLSDQLQDTILSLEQQKKQPGSREINTHYHLVDFKKVDSWLDKALEAANARIEELVKKDQNEDEAEYHARMQEYSSLSTALIGEESLKYLKAPASGTTTVRAFEQASRYWTGKEFRYQELNPHVLAELNDKLREGRKWQWLEQRAYPLGEDTHAVEEMLFTVMCVPNVETLRGNEGTGSPYFHSNWDILKTIRTHEISSIRGVINFDK